MSEIFGRSSFIVQTMSVNCFIYRHYNVSNGHFSLFAMASLKNTELFHDYKSWKMFYNFVKVKRWILCRIFWISCFVTSFYWYQIPPILPWRSEGLREWLWGTERKLSKRQINGYCWKENPLHAQLSLTFNGWIVVVQTLNAINV